jgi:hypothetical protein
METSAFLLKFQLAEFMTILAIIGQKLHLRTVLDGTRTDNRPVKVLSVYEP